MWCLFQAVREQERGQLQKANTIAVAMDERQERMLVTYAACSGTDISAGILALLRHPGRNADMVATCVQKAVRHFCTSGKQHPTMNRVRARPKVMRHMEQHILDHVEMFSADGAANEQLAGRLHHPHVERSGQAQKLKRLKMIIRDKAHSARRLTSRTFCVDEVLNNILKMVLFNKPSIAKMLKHSRPCQEIFDGELKRQGTPGRPSGPGGAAGPTDLGFAKQRFDNTARPLSVVVWNLDALHSTCEMISRDASIDMQYRRLCQQFLGGLSEETILLLGMLGMQATRR